MARPSFLDELNTRQQEAVTSTEGRIRVIAGAGTGKTRALTYRYAYLVNVLGIDPANILCLTFTNKAAAQMRQRISHLVQSGDYNDYVCTLHGFCVKFLRREIYRLGFPKGFAILDEEDGKDLAKECMDELGIERKEKTVKQFMGEIAKEKALNGYIEAYMLPSSKVSEEMKLSKIVRYLSKQLKTYSLDFDDLMNFTLYILDHFEDCREKWQEELNYIMVDEAQDCNLDDWNLVEKLACRHNNLFVVGDPDQCIYEWRGARPTRFVEFASDKDIVLDENYRSTPEILSVANCVIANNQNRIPKDLFTRNGGGKVVVHYHAKSEKKEAKWVVDRIEDLLHADASPEDFAVLYRSSHLSRGIEQALLQRQIPYNVWGGVRFFERKEIKDAIAYLRLCNNPRDDSALLRIINTPSRKLGKTFISKLRDTAYLEEKSLFDTLEEHLGEMGRKGAAELVALVRKGQEMALSGERVSNILEYVLDASSLKKSLREDQDEEKLENVEELSHSILSWEETHSGEEPSLADYLQDIALYTNADYRKESSSVKLMTIHQAKGLEFPFVFVFGLNEGIFPSLRTIREFKKNGEEEERRLMYVAITRAEKALFLTESEGFNSCTRTSKYPSRFLAEIHRDIVVREGAIPDELWKETLSLNHVLDEESYVPEVPGAMAAAQSGIDIFQEDRQEYSSPFKVGGLVVHEVFGEGEIVSANTDYSSFKVRFGDGLVRNIRAAFLQLPDLPF